MTKTTFFVFGKIKMKLVWILNKGDNESIQRIVLIGAAQQLGLEVKLMYFTMQNQF